MTLRDDLNAMTPRLRRYARALATGTAAGSDRADELVHVTLMRALGARTLGSSADLAIRLYATVTQLHREVLIAGKPALAAGGGRPSLVNNDINFPQAIRQTKLSAALLKLSLEEREALLLVALEGFEHGDAARILRVSRPILLNRLTQARQALDKHLQPQQSEKQASRTVPHLRLVT